MVIKLIFLYYSIFYGVNIVGGPGVKEFKQSKNLVQGERLQLDCDAWGHPLPTVTWQHKESPIDTSDERVSVNNFGDIVDGTLVITNVDYDDGGHYTCIASSFGNSANSTVLVRVKGKCYIMISQ